MAIMSAVYAVEPDALLRDQQLREQQQLEQLQVRPDVFLQDNDEEQLAEGVDTVARGPCFEVQHIQLQAMPSGWAGWLLQPSPLPLPKCLDSQDIKTIITILSNRLIAKGYITSRIELPAQNLQQGILVLRIQVGHIDAIRSQEGKSDRALSSAFPVQQGDILNIRDIEQGVEQLSIPMTQQAQVDIVPGEEWGSSDIVVKRTHQFPLSTGASLDNSGADATGRWQLSGYLIWDRPLQLNDVLILAYNQDSRRTHNPGSRGSSLTYTLPWGKWTGSVNLSHYDYQQPLTGFSLPLMFSGQSKNWSVSLGRLLHRTQTSKTELTTQLTQKINHSYIEEVELTTQRRRLSLLSIGLMHRHYVGAVIVDAQINFQRGIGWFNAESVPSPLPPSYPTARERVYLGKLRTQYPFHIAQTSWRWMSEWRWQYSPDVLFGTEQMSMGNYYTVRGFRQGLAGNSGHYWRNDLVWSLLPPNQKGRMLDVYVGADVGRINAVAYPIDTQTLAGWVMGARAAITKHIHAEISIESPIHASHLWPRERVVYGKLGISG